MAVFDDLTPYAVNSNERQLLRVVDDIRNEKISYVDLLIILDKMPSLYQFLREDQWDCTIANHVAHHHPMYLVYAPRTLITKIMYDAYLFAGAKQLGFDFSPFYVDEYIDLKTAVFMLRSCRRIVDKFITNKKYKHHILKMAKRGEVTYNGHYVDSGLIFKILANPTKYIGKDSRFDSIVIEMLFEYEAENKKYSREQILNLLNIDFDRLFAKAISFNTYSAAKFAYMLYESSEGELRQKIVDICFKDLGIKDAIDYDTYGWCVPHSQFFGVLLDNEFKADLELPDGTIVTIKQKHWWFKRLIKTLQSSASIMAYARNITNDK